MIAKRRLSEVQINDALGNIPERIASAKAAIRKRIEEQARPEETYEQAANRFHQETDPIQNLTHLPSALHKASNTEDQAADFFIPVLYDLGARDSRSVMDVAVFRLSKKDRRVSEVIRYDLPDGHVEVSAGPAGMASVWDYDLVLMAVSHLTEAVNRYREGKGEKPGRVFRPYVADVLKFCRRSDGGKQKDDLVQACLRLNTTHVAVQRFKKSKNGRIVTISEGEALISRYKITSNQAGNPEHIEIELAEWMYREVVDGKNPDVLTVHPDYFLIDPGIGRFVYRLARRAAGRRQAKWAFQTVYERSGSAGTLNKFAFTLRRLINSNKMPEYELTEEAGLSGPLLVMTYREVVFVCNQEIKSGS